MKIAITNANATKIQNALDAVNGNARDHTIHTVMEIIDLAGHAEKRMLDLLESKKAAVGAIYRVVSGRSVANKYSYRRVGNVVEITRGSSRWYLTNVERCDLWPRDGGTRRTILTAKQDKIAVRKFREMYEIAK